MKFAADDEHREYYQEHQEIAFEQVLSPEECNSIKNEIRNAISKSLKIKIRSFETQDPKLLFEAGRDLWRGSEVLQKIVCQRNLAEVASQLSTDRPIRMGYDQYFPALPLIAKENENTYRNLLQTPSSIKQISSLQGVSCGWLLSISPEENEAGTLTFFSPTRKIDWPTLFLKPGRDYYLVVYTPIKSVYKINNKDPNSRSFMRAGYAAGDLLNDAFNPILYR